MDAEYHCSFAPVVDLEKHGELASDQNAIHYNKKIMKYIADRGPLNELLDRQYSKHS